MAKLLVVDDARKKAEKERAMGLKESLKGKDADKWGLEELRALVRLLAEQAGLTNG